MRLVSVTLCSLLLFPVVFAQNPQAGTALGSVSGLVVQATDGAPLRKVTVSLLSANQINFSFPRRQRSPFSTATDAEGHFRIEAVPPGDYRITLDRPGFISAGRMSQQDSSASVSVGKGQQVDGLLFRMQPAGVIRGRIVDEDGDPLPNVNVMATTGSGRMTYGNGTTNDLGEYRIAGLRAGRYVVMAQGGQSIPGDGKSNRAYAPTFFPGTTERSQAAMVDVHPGDEVEAVFGLAATRTFSVRGQVSGMRQTNPRAGTGMVFIQRTDSQWAPPLNSQLMPDGSFEIKDVVPGNYRLTVNSPTGEQSNLMPGTDTIEVRGSDVDGLRLAVGPGGEVRGKFRMDNGQPFDWAQLNVVLDPDGREMRRQLFAKVEKDGSFTIKDVPADNYHAIVTANSNNLRDYITKEVNVNGKDAGDSGFATGPGVSTLDIVVSANGSAIVGTVVDGDDKTVSDIRVACIPDEARQKRHDIFEQDRTDKHGQFSLRGLNPGEYTVFALREEEGDITDPDFIQQHEAEGQKLRLDEGEQKTVVLKFSWNQ